MPQAPINIVPDGFDDAFAEYLSQEDADTQSTMAGEDPDGDAAATAAETKDQGEDGADGEGTEGEDDDPDGGDEGAGGEEEGDPAEGTEGEDEDGTGEDGDDDPDAAVGDEPVKDDKDAKPAKKDAKPAKDDSSDEDVLARLVSMLGETQTKDKPAKDQQQQKPEEQAEPELYTDEEKRILEEYKKEWPEVAQAEQLQRRGEYRQIVDYVFNEVAAQLAPLAQTVQTVSERAHLQDLHETVGDDYDVVREDVVSWVETQPSYLQTAYKHVIEKGTVEEVADLVNRFKTETGRDQPAPAPKPAAKSTRKKETELPASTKKAAASLAPVSSKRSVVPQGEDPSDFESAFDTFAGKL